MAASLLLGGCEARGNTGPIVVSAIGETHGARVLAGATEQGLVRFDAAGEIEPGLAQRWILLDDGRAFVFRLADGAPDARPVARILDRRRRRSSFAQYLSAIDAVVPMTGQVVELRLARPRPDLLALLAQPEMGIPGAGGPFRVTGRRNAAIVLTPVRPSATEQGPAAPKETIALRGERAALAVTRFAAGRADFVTGGTIEDWPLVAVADLAAAAIRLDPAAGLFGLAVTRRTGFLAVAEHRAALAGAFDRRRLVALARGWTQAERVLPDQLDSAAPPAAAAWTAVRLARRQAATRTLVEAWGEPITLSLALPTGPGGGRLWARLSADLRAVGVTPRRVGKADTADLTLIDAVAPYDSARWYLDRACVRCDSAAAGAIQAARLASALDTRAAALARADAALAADAGFIPLARPLRWSLVAPRLRAWRPNRRAWHPLNHLRRATT